MPIVDAGHPANRSALRALQARDADARPLTAASEAVNPYEEAGCHPEIVGWLWERLAKGLPPDARCLVYGTPCVVQTTSGILLAAGMGTQYVLRILPGLQAAAAAAGCTPVHDWSGHDGVIDLRETFGEDWVFGTMTDDAPAWCHAAFRHFSSPPPAGATLITPATAARAASPDGQLVLRVGQGADQPRVVAVAPDAAAVESVMRSLDWSRFTMVILGTDGDHFLEVSGSVQPEDGLFARVVEASEECVARDAPDLDVALTLLQAYATGAPHWRDVVEWE